MAKTLQDTFDLPSPPWRVQIVPSGGLPRTTVELTNPFALVGSHAACHVQIRSSSAPEICYALFSMVDGIEAWPLGPLAFARWGPLGRETELQIGGTRLRVFQDGSSKIPASDGIPLTRSPDRVHVLEFDAGKKKRLVRLERAISIIGSAHPSTIRVRGARLEACDLAAISYDQGCWLIDLRVRRGDHRREPLFLPVGQQRRLGKLQFTFHVKKNPHGDVPQQDSSGSLPVDTFEIAAASSTASNQPTPAVRPTVKAESRPRTLAESVATPPAISAQDLTAERLTDRLVGRHQKKNDFAIWVRWASLGSLGLVALVVVIWVLAILIPTIARIYGYQ